MQFVIIENAEREKEKGTLLLIGILFICFWLQWFLNEHHVNKLLLSDFSFMQLISHQFIHVHSIHLIINLVLLYIFGKFVESRAGIFLLYILFFCAGITGGISHLLFRGGVAAGASGAISGLIGSSLILDAKSKIYFFDRMFYIPVWVMASLWVIKDLLALTLPSLRSGPAAHLGGFVTGVVLTFIFVKSKKIIFPE